MSKLPKIIQIMNVHNSAVTSVFVVVLLDGFTILQVKRIQISYHAIVHFKRLGSRHIHKEIEISQCVFGFIDVICKTDLKHIQTLTHNCNIINEEHFEAI